MIDQDETYAAETIDKQSIGTFENLQHVPGDRSGSYRSGSVFRTDYKYAVRAELHVMLYKVGTASMWRSTE